MRSSLSVLFSCNSPIGMSPNGGGPTKGAVTINLDLQLKGRKRGCMDHKTIIHEIFHALGLAHEHSRFDRDDHVKIIKKNVIEGFAETSTFNALII